MSILFCFPISPGHQCGVMRDILHRCCARSQPRSRRTRATMPRLLRQIGQYESRSIGYERKFGIERVCNPADSSPGHRPRHRIPFSEAGLFTPSPSCTLGGSAVPLRSRACSEDICIPRTFKLITLPLRAGQCSQLLRRAKRPLAAQRLRKTARPARIR